MIVFRCLSYDYRLIIHPFHSACQLTKSARQGNVKVIVLIMRGSILAFADRPEDKTAHDLGVKKGGFLRQGTSAVAYCFNVIN